MSVLNTYTPEEINKIGNTLIFLTEHMRPMSKTKLLKLIYIVQESSVLKFGLPFFDIRFDLWHLGPVNPDLYTEITSYLYLFDGYIDCPRDFDGSIRDIKPLKPFSDDEFSDNEIELLEEIVAKHKQDSGGDLIAFTHEPGGPWYETAKKNDLLERFQQRLVKTTNIEIDLSILVKNDPVKRDIYEHHKEHLALSRLLKY